MRMPDAHTGRLKGALRLSENVRCAPAAQVPMMREAILKGADWEVIAAAQKEGAFGHDAAEQTQLRRRALLSTLDALCVSQPNEDTQEVSALTRGPMQLWHALHTVAQRGVSRPASQPHRLFNVLHKLLCYRGKYSLKPEAWVSQSAGGRHYA
jgi:hypothetical protein